MFFLCRLLFVIVETVFFRVQYFLLNKSSCSNPFLHQIMHFRKALAVMRFVYIIYLPSTCLVLSDAVIISGDYLDLSSYFQCIAFLWNTWSLHFFPVAAIHLMNNLSSITKGQLHLHILSNLLCFFREGVAARIYHT